MILLLLLLIIILGADKYECCSITAVKRSLIFSYFCSLLQLYPTCRTSSPVCSNSYFITSTSDDDDDECIHSFKFSSSITSVIIIRVRNERYISACTRQPPALCINPFTACVHYYYTITAAKIFRAIASGYSSQLNRISKGDQAMVMLFVGC